MDNAALIPIQIAQDTLGAFRASMNLARTVRREFDPLDPRNEGETVRVGKRGALTANRKTRGEDVTIQEPEAGFADVKLTEHFEVTINVDDVHKVVTPSGINTAMLEGYGQDAATALLEKIEGFLAGLYAKVSSPAIVWDATSYATKRASINKIRKSFVASKVPEGEVKNIYAGIELADSIISDEKFTSANDTEKNEDYVNGRISKKFGFEFFESVLAPRVGAIEHSLAYTKNAIGLALRPLPIVPAGLGAVQSTVNDDELGIGLRSTMSYDAKKMEMLITLDVLFGGDIIDQRRVRHISYTVPA